MASYRDSKMDDVEKPEKAVDVPVDTASVKTEELYSLAAVDPALQAKMTLVNHALNEIGLTTYHWKLFCLNGMGYATDSLLLLVQGIIATKARYEFNPSFPNGLTIAVYVGMLVGALFWGFGADIIGRKIAFNVSLLISGIFAIVAGAANSWILLGTFIAISAFGAGGNLIMDTAVFLEYCPSRYSWLLTMMAAWWGVGQLIAGLAAWAFLPNFSNECISVETCTRANNMGWRYVWFFSGGLVFVASLLRIFIIRLRETPKFLIGKGRDEEVVETLQFIATKYNRPCSLTLEKLQACGEIQVNKRGKGFSLLSIVDHLRGLFSTRKLGISTVLIWLSWTLIGLAYPLYNVFLPTYLASRGARFGETSQAIYWRDYALSNLCSIPGPIIAAFLCEIKFLGRKGTMVIGALITMAFFFAYTQVRTSAQNLGFNLAISCCLNIYYGTLYAYTPEVLPSAHRTTGNGVAVACNRIMGILSAVIAYYADTTTSVPIYVCAGLYIVMAIVALLFPYEPLGKSSQ